MSLASPSTRTHPHTVKNNKNINVFEVENVGIKGTGAEDVLCSAGRVLADAFSDSKFPRWCRKLNQVKLQV